MSRWSVAAEKLAGLQIVAGVAGESRDWQEQRGESRDNDRGSHEGDEG